MATVTSFTAARMQQIENASVIDGGVVGGDLILTRHDGTQINAGNVRGPQGFPGPTGDVEEAPEDGKVWVRQNGAWIALSSAAAPADGQRYVMKDGVWTQLVLPAAAPVDGQKYLIQNGTYVRANRPWFMAFTHETVTPPSGFSVGSVVTAGSAYWTVVITGSGYEVNYSLRYVINSSAESASVRMTLPTNVRPAVDVFTTAYFGSLGGVTDINGVGLGRINTNGQVLAPTQEAVILTGIDGTPQEGSEIRTMSITVDMNGSFTRNAETLPNGANYLA